MIYDEDGTLYDPPANNHSTRLYEAEDTIRRAVQRQIKEEAQKIEADMRLVLNKLGMNLDTDWPKLAKLGYDVVYQRSPLNVSVYRGIMHDDVWDIDYYPEWG